MPPPNFFYLYSSRNKRGMRPHVIVDVRREQILNRFWEHQTIDQIATEMNLHIDTVRAYIRRAKKSGDERAIRQFPTGDKRVMQARARRRRIVALFDSGVTSASEIAKRVNCCERLVHMRLKEARG